MVEIIKEGKLPGEQEYTGTCRNCGTVAKFKGNEAQEKAAYGALSTLHIACPLEGCHSTIVVSKHPLTQHLEPKVVPLPFYPIRETITQPVDDRWFSVD